MRITDLIEQIKTKRSFLCVGLDTDIQKIPKFLLEFDDPIFEFNRRIIDATGPYCVSYKLNTAFYEVFGSKGWDTLEKTSRYIGPEFFTIADAKRGDIGNTSDMYAKAFFKDMNFDSVTVAPYMGSDSVSPFLKYEDKFTILLALTSNPGAMDFQMTKNTNGDFLFENVLKTSKTWENSERLMYVVGATRPDYFTMIRKIVPYSFLLVPGIGAQGGSLTETCKYGMNNHCGLLVNSSRGIIYAGNDENFDSSAGEEAHKLQIEMSELLKAIFPV